VTGLPGTGGIFGQIFVNQFNNVRPVAFPPVFCTGGIAGLVTGSTYTQYAGGVTSTCYAGVATPVSRNVALFAGEQTVVDSVDNVSHVAQNLLCSAQGV